MSEEAVILEVARTFTLIGIGIGLVLRLMLAELVGAYREWRQSLEHRRQIHCLKKDWK